MTMREDRYVTSIYDACAALHSDVCGSGDPLSLHQFIELTDWLKMRIDSWTPSVPSESKRYDDCVKSLAEAALAEANDKLDTIAAQWWKEGLTNEL